jgi:DNA-binding FrmR family transcriptional regulator
MLKQGLACAAVTVMICAVCAALLQLAAQILSLSFPAAVATATLAGVAVLNTLRRRIRTRGKHRSGAGNRLASGGRPA